MFFSLEVDDELELQLLEEDHAQGLFRIIEECRDYLDTWLPWVRENTTLGDSVDYIHRSRAKFGKGEAIPTGLVYRGELCGTAGLTLDGRTGELGYWVHRDYQGRGIVTRACKALTDFGFEHRGMRRCIVRVAPENDKSWAIPERLGFTLEGTAREAGAHPDGYFDLRVYSLLRREWHDGWPD